MVGPMAFLVFTALFAGQLVTSSPPTIFTSEEISALREESKQTCGHAGPQELMALEYDKRQKVLPCFIAATVRRSEPLLPKIIEPGATIVSVSNFQGLPVFALQFSASHPRASVPKNQSSDYDRLLSTRACNDKWLGGLIDAGMVEGTQAGAVIVFKLQTEKGDGLAAVAVARCDDPK